ncbi:MAG: hypothetical protein EBU90_28840, partial [Proteobacteria bacterium]|nr:hypothetical protein [Pseudomonadota bacterium]
MGKSRQAGKLVSDNILFADITNDRVGIGTTNPLSTLTVTGNALFNGTGIVTATQYYGDASNLTKTFPLVTNILYVTKNGNDSNPGTRLSEPKATIAGAVGAATTGTVIKVSAGT